MSPPRRPPATAKAKNGNGDGVRAPHRPSRRQEIIEGAISVFGAEGVVTTTIADIAEACGVVPASVYYHFESKEAVLAAAMEQIGDEIIDVQEAQDLGGEPSRDLRPRVRAVFGWAQGNPDKARLFYLWSVGISPEIEAQRRRFVEGRIEGAKRYQRVRSRTKQDELNRTLAARTAIELAMAASVAWTSGDVFSATTDPDRVADSLADAMVRILGG